MPDFFAAGPATDPHFVALRDSTEPIVANGRAFVERLWTQVAPYLDEDVPRCAAQSYLPRFWEMYITHVLLESKIDLVPRAKRTPAKKGPDLLAERPRVWVEAVAPSPGDGPDAVPELVTGALGTVPDEQIKLRLRSAIEEKRQRIDSYRQNGWVRPEEPAVVAVSAARIPAAIFEATIPRIIRCLLPFGDETFHIDRASLEVVDRSFKYQPQVKKRSGSAVSTDLFRDPAYRSISAVLYSRADELSRPPTPGQEFILCHNPLAAAQLPRGWLPVGWEYWVENDHLHSVEHALGSP